MKKILSLFALVLMCVLVFCGCESLSTDGAQSGAQTSTEGESKEPIQKITAIVLNDSFATYGIEPTFSEDFAKARNKALFNEIQHFLNPEETTLISFSDIKKMLKPGNETYLGMKTVPVKLIVGSESRYQDFDNRFFPKKMHLKTRWEHIDMAHIKDINLPPITLYELGGLYFVRRLTTCNQIGTE